MSLLPKNERKVAKETPRNFVIYGGTMHGKTFFSEEFPNPLNLNTDGNADMIETPSLNIGHERDAKGVIKKSASDYLTQVIDELQGTNHSFETVIIDVIDDVITLFEQEITEEANVTTVGDIPYGKGHQALEMMVRVFVMRLKELSAKKKMNVIYISRLNTIEENDATSYVPSLKQKWMNIVNGNSDYTILCRKIGKKYLRKVESKRKNYTRDMIDDERITQLLDTVVGAYDKSQKTSTNEAKKLAAEQEKQQEAERKARQAERKKQEQTQPETEANAESEKQGKADQKEQAKEQNEDNEQEQPKKRPPRPVTK
ncbi:phage-associated ATpase [Gracilibacillus halophilus YIM-C55.5]|uniref:Phage-associated ATpase n=1 Tax=Gracilibacillus halophilus YIM-C55.5 TaxID=1308866 RepID=N4WBR5_9BACI|nr:AAA family ATPase [Gracilibacillus halophilus]ENH96704.1 phage-associated ATpase [Gracilibacillus halophilus YIM-C55.5]